MGVVVWTAADDRMLWATRVTVVTWVGVCWTTEGVLSTGDLIGCAFDVADLCCGLAMTGAACD